MGNKETEAQRYQVVRQEGAQEVQPLGSPSCPFPTWWHLPLSCHTSRQPSLPRALHSCSFSTLSPSQRVPHFKMISSSPLHTPAPLGSRVQPGVQRNVTK